MYGLGIPTNECIKSGELRLPYTLPSMQSHTSNIQTCKLCLPLYSFVHQTKGLLLHNSHRCIGACLPDIGPQGLSNILQHRCTLFCNDRAIHYQDIQTPIESEYTTPSDRRKSTRRHGLQYKVKSSITRPRLILLPPLCVPVHLDPRSVFSSLTCSVPYSGIPGILTSD